MLALATLLLAAAAIWYAGRDLSWQLHRDGLLSAGPKGVLLRWLPLLCAALVLVGAACGLYSAAGDIQRVAGVKVVAPIKDMPR